VTVSTVGAGRVLVSVCAAISMLPCASMVDWSFVTELLRFASSPFASRVASAAMLMSPRLNRFAPPLFAMSPDA